jgi:DNA polymerase-3 subunit beta
MQIQLDRRPFLKALNHQQGIVERKVTIPLLSNLLLRTEDEGFLEIVGTDLELTLVDRVPARVQKMGVVTAPAHLLYDIIRKCPDNHPIEISLDEDTRLLCIKCGESRFQVPTLPEDGYPTMVEHHPSHAFQISGKDLSRLIDQTRFAMSTEESSFFLNGIYVHAEAAHLKAVATDAHRLALSWTRLPETANGLQGAILSRKTVTELRKLIESEDAVVEVAFSQTQASFSCDGTTFFARFVNGTFPKYTEAIPSANSLILEVDTALFRAAVDRVSVISAQEKVRLVRLSFEDNELSLSAKGMETGSGTEKVAIKYDGEPFSINFNARYVLDAVQQVKGQIITFQFKDAHTPVILKDSDDDKVLYVLMPVRASI